MLMSSGREDPSLRDFLSIAKKLLDKDIPIPQIFNSDVKKGLLILEDLGDITLEKLQKDFKEKSHKFYLQSLKYLISMQTHIKYSGSEPRFDAIFFREEVLLAASRLHAFIKKTPESFSAFQEEVHNFCLELEQDPFVFCHRDFHSRNIMVKEEKARFIDFQDAGFGPYCYDLCSLVYDSYVNFSQTEREDFIRFYFKNLSKDLKLHIKNPEAVFRLVDMQFLQRGYKACGCFAGFYVDRGQRTHLPYIKSTVEILIKRAEKLQAHACLKYFKDLIILL